MPEYNVVTVDPDGLEVDVTIHTATGATASPFTTTRATSAISLPATISSATDFWLAEAGDFTFIVSKDGTELYRETVGVSEREDQHARVSLKGKLTLGQSASLGGGSGATPTQRGMYNITAEVPDNTFTRLSWSEASGTTDHPLDLTVPTIPKAKVDCFVLVQMQMAGLATNPLVVQLDIDYQGDDPTQQAKIAAGGIMPITSEYFCPADGEIRVTVRHTEGAPTVVFSGPVWVIVRPV